MRLKQMEQQVRRCGVCGQEWPSFSVEDVNHALLGCESCLVIKEDGVVQL